MIDIDERMITIKDFPSRNLENNREINIYIPSSYYEDNEKSYPVLYMHDGQNVFDGERAYAGVGWTVHEVHDELVSRGMIRELIIVGIDNMQEDRLSEYAHVNGRFKRQRIMGKGKLYERFLIEELKPFVDENFRTLTGPEDTGLMGSSMGGLVTFNIGFRNPHVFGRLGIISPSFWWGTRANINTVDIYQDALANSRIWIDMGTKEGGLDRSFDKVVERILTKSDRSRGNIEAHWIIGAAHTETDWQRRVHWPLIHLFGLD
ncbi:alpha/beta hydrolase [Gudongella sp. SC589]|jgi:predicted alpha/beta superfamily hydrolase|uniref:alpha/beta hydrolase n=1 Tax=Gudongella sp. SC589 TaxID=3385990 RepID=UPI003904D182